MTQYSIKSSWFVILLMYQIVTYHILWIIWHVVYIHICLLLYDLLYHMIYIYISLYDILTQTPACGWAAEKCHRDRRVTHRGSFHPVKPCTSPMWNSFAEVPRDPRLEMVPKLLEKLHAHETCSCHRKTMGKPLENHRKLVV